MSYFARFSPVTAIRDLRHFLALRSKYEIVFFFLSLFLTGMILWGFQIDSRVERPYKREIIYFDNWPSTRTDAEIVAKQKADQPEIDRKRAELKAWQEKRKAEFKKVDDAMNSWGI